jgi:hypothetical protein
MHLWSILFGHGSVRSPFLQRKSKLLLSNVCDARSRGGRCERNPHVMNGLLKRNTHARLVSSAFTFDRIRRRFHPSSNTVARSSSSHCPHSSTGKQHHQLTVVIYCNHHHHISCAHLLEQHRSSPRLAVILRRVYVLRYGGHRPSTLSSS